MFDLAQLRCFVAVAEELHFGRAAQRLAMTQPPLSRQVQLLEHALGARLLERSSRAVRLTPAGRSFLPEARRILRLADSAARLASRVAAGKTGLLKIGFTASTAYAFLPRLVQACRAAAPEVELSLREMVSGEQLDALAAGLLDIGLLRPPVLRPGLRAELLGAEALLLAVPQEHPLAGRASVPIAALDGEPFINYAPFESRYFHDLLQRAFAAARIRPRDVQFLSQIHSILAMVRAGLGLAIVPRAAAHLRFAGVALRPLSLAAPMEVELYLVHTEGNDNPLVPLLLGLARESMRELDQSIQS